MSIIVEFTAFNRRLADSKWDNFEGSLEEAKQNRVAIGQLCDERDEALQPTDEELYGKAFVGQRDPKAEKRAEVSAMIEKKSAENQILETQLFDDVTNGNHIESEDTSCFVQADLAFGSSAVVDFDLRHIKTPANSLLLMFPEFGTEDADELTVDQWLYVFKHKAELPQRATEHREDLMEWSNEDSEFTEFTRDLGIFLQQMKPVVEGAMLPDSRLIITYDSGPTEDEELLTRAKHHAEELKKMPKYKDLFAA